MSDELRRCSFCGDGIDPIDYCLDCRDNKCTVHKHPRKRSDAKFCNSECRIAYVREYRKAKR